MDKKGHLGGASKVMILFFVYRGAKREAVGIFPASYRIVHRCHNRRVTEVTTHDSLQEPL